MASSAICVAAISSIAIALIGLVAQNGDLFKPIIQMDVLDCGVLLGASAAIPS